MANIKYVPGNATYPIGDGNKLIVHCCNNLGKWGSGFVLALSKRWSDPEKIYRAKGKYELGTAEFVQVEEDIGVANIIGQDGIGTGKDGLPPIHYEALRRGFKESVKLCKRFEATVHMPRIGAGLAGGDWAIIEILIQDTFIRNGIDVVVYEFGSHRDSRDSIDPKDTKEAWKARAEDLWQIIDDIDTYSDMAKSDDKMYRGLVENKQRKRFKILTSDGYNLFIPGREPKPTPP